MGSDAARVPAAVEGMRPALAERQRGRAIEVEVAVHGGPRA